MILDELAFAASAGLAQVMTNLDNMAVLIGLLFTIGRGRAVTGYALSQAVMLAAAMAVAMGLDRAVPGWAGWLGMVPLLLGSRGIWMQWRNKAAGQDMPRLPAKSGVIAATALFLALSMDSFAVMAPLLADSQPGYRLWALGGAVLAVAVLGALALSAARIAGPARQWAARLERLGPAVMIAAGVYILINSGTDVVP